MVCCETLTIFCYLLEFFLVCLIVSDSFDKIFKSPIVSDEVLAFNHAIIIINAAALTNIGCSAKHSFFKCYPGYINDFLWYNSHFIRVKIGYNVIICQRMFKWFSR